MNTLKYIKKTSIITTLVFLFLVSKVYSSEEDHDHHSNESDVHAEGESGDDHKNEEEGFELSTKAIKLMSVETAPIKSYKSNSFIVPNLALVRHGEKYGLYKYDGEHFELINLTNLKKEKSFFISKTNLLKNGDLIVVKGAPLLRVAHLQASGQGGEGHGH